MTTITHSVETVLGMAVLILAPLVMWAFWVAISDGILR